MKRRRKENDYEYFRGIYVKVIKNENGKKSECKMMDKGRI